MLGAEFSNILKENVTRLAQSSSKFQWVGIYILNGNNLSLGPYVGEPTPHSEIPVGKGICGTAVAQNKDLNIPDVTQAANYLACSTETRSELVVLIRDRNGRIVGQIDIDSHTKAAFGPQEELQVKNTAENLGRLWPIGGENKQWQQ